jgi:hypothetical protein
MEMGVSHGERREKIFWIPAYAGMTEKGQGRGRKERE